MGMVAIVAIMLVSSCSMCNMETGVRHITVLQDVTDEVITVPEPQKLVSELGLDTKSWEGMELKYGIISDTEYTNEEVLSLPAESSWMGNEFQRKKKVEDFIMDLEGLVNSIERGNRPHSIIFPVIVREVNRLSEIEEDGEKTLIVFSDLMENAPNLSCHNRNVRNMDVARADKLWSGLVSNYNMALTDNLEGVEVRFVHKTQGYGKSRQFSNLSDMYRRKLESKGAQVSISANL